MSRFLLVDDQPGALKALNRVPTLVHRRRDSATCPRQVDLPERFNSHAGVLIMEDLRMPGMLGTPPHTSARKRLPPGGAHELVGLRPPQWHRGSHPPKCVVQPDPAAYQKRGGVHPRRRCAARQDQAPHALRPSRVARVSPVSPVSPVSRQRADRQLLDRNAAVHRLEGPAACGPDTAGQVLICMFSALHTHPAVARLAQCLAGTSGLRTVPARAMEDVDLSLTTADGTLRVPGPEHTAEHSP